MDTEMRKNSYLKWMSGNTATQWCNDSALSKDYRAAMEYGAIGCTTNPPLTYQAIIEHPELFGQEVNEIKRRVASAAERVVEYLGIVVKRISEDFLEMNRRSDKKIGYVRSQVSPRLAEDAAAMFQMGKKIALFNENVMVKLPGTKPESGFSRATALGIPTTATVCVSVSQVIEAAEAYERGCARAAIGGIEAPQSTAALVIGRLQDFLSVVNEGRGSPVAPADLELACLAVAKKAHSIFAARKYAQKIMPAAFRSPMQVVQLVGGDFHMTIHPKIQDQLIEVDMREPIKREITIDRPVDEKAVIRVIQSFPEFRMAYEPGGLSMDEFADFGPTKMTLEAFDKTGWQKLLAL